MVVIMMHVTLLLVSLRLNYSPPSHSEIFFYILSHPNIFLSFQENVYKDFPTTTTVFVFVFFATQTNVQNYSFQLTVQVNNCKTDICKSYNCKQIADTALSTHT